MEKKNDEERFLDFTERFLRNCAGFMLAVIVCVVVLSIVVCLGGCTTVRTRRNAGDIRKSDTYIAGGIESAVSAFDDGIGRAVRESRGIADEVDRLEFLFDRYEQHALRLRNEVDSLRKQIENKGEDNLDGGNNHSD